MPARWSSLLGLGLLLQAGLVAVGATPAFVQEKDNQVTSGTTNAVKFTSNTTAGNLLVVYLIWDSTSAASVTDSLGNVYTAGVSPARWSSGKYSTQVFYATNAAGGADTVTATFGTAVTQFGIVYAHEYSGVRQSAPLDVTATATGTSGSLNSGSAPTSYATDLIFAGGVSAATVTAAGSGFTARSKSEGNMTEDRVVTAVGSYSATATNSSGAWGMQMVAFKGASGTTDTTAPTVPTGLAAVGNSSTQITVSWTASTDPDNTAAQLIYSVSRNGSRITTTAAGVTSFADTGLTASTAYSYTIFASDPSGNSSAQSSAIQATTLAPPDTTPPTAPTKLAVTGTTSSTASLSWTASTDNVGVTGYKIFRAGAPGAGTSDRNLLHRHRPGLRRPPILIQSPHRCGRQQFGQILSRVGEDACASGHNASFGSYRTCRYKHHHFQRLDLLSGSASNPIMRHAVTGYKIFRAGVQVGTSTAVSYTDSGLAASTTYSYTVSAYDAAGNNSAQSTALQATTQTPKDTTPPSVPTGLAVSGTTTSSVSLTWTASTDNVGVTGYKIFRGGVQVGTSAVATYTDSSLTASTTYSYSVSAFDAAGNNSAQSAAVQATTQTAPDTTPPSVPTGLTVSSSTTSSVSLSWTPSTDNVGVTGYKIYRAGVQVGTSTGTSYTDTGLTASTKYSYSVSAFDAAGNNSAQSAAVQATTQTAPDTTPPSVPTGLTVSSTTTSAVSLSWTASTDNVGVTGYKIYRAGVQVGTSAVATYTDSSLTASTTYSYTVSAFDAAGNNSAPSAAVQATTQTAPDTTPPSVPTGLTVSSTTTSAVSLSWTASTDNVGVTGYKIYRAGVQVGTSAVATYTDSSLTASTTYSYTVSAFDAAGNNSAQSAAVQATTQTAPDTTPPSVPTGLTVSSTTTSAVSLSWTASTDNVGVTGYKIFRAGVQVGTSAVATYTDGSLTASTTYSYTVSAFDAAGNNSVQSAAVQATTQTAPDTTPPSVPTGLTVSSTTTSAVSLSWTASTDNVGVTGYKIFRAGVQVGTSTVPSYTDGSLTASTTYSYTVSAFDAAGNNSAQSAAVQATTQTAPDTTPPSVPTGLTVSSTTTSAVSLSWTASTDNVGVTGYKIYRAGVQVGTSAIATYTDGSLTASTTYSYTVSAFDAAGNNSAQSAAVQATTQTAPDTTPPSVPIGLFATGTTSTMISLSWTASTDNVGVTGYKIFRAGTQVGTSATNSYSDSGLPSSTTFSYTVSAYDAAGNNSSQSTSIAATTASSSFSAVHLGIMGASSSDEYRADDDLGGAYAATTFNWAELLAKYRAIDIGAWGTYPEPRRSGYANNWARSGALAADLQNEGQAAGVAGQVAAGLVNTVVIYIGGNDFSQGTNYSDIYSGVITGQALQNKISGIISSITQAADAARSAGTVNMIVTTIGDPGQLASMISQYPDASGRLLVTNAILAVNSGIVAMAASRPGVVIFDLANIALPYPIDANSNMLSSAVNKVA